MEKNVIKQFYHEHPLILTDDLSHKDSLDCYVCGHPITSVEKVYACTDVYCGNRISLHKRCGELPSQISHHKHPHPLYLFDHHECTHCYCSLCLRDFGKALGYRCSVCDFDVDINCEKIGIDALLEKKQELEHQSHPQHPLTLMRKPPLSFYCDGCGVRDVDMAFICSVCEFWVHKSCALLPQLLPVNRRHHHHPLSLAFSFPAEVRYAEFRYRCDVCDKRFDETCWLYFCRDCRFFAHIKCVAATSETPNQASLDDGDGPGAITLPLDVHDMYTKLIMPFVMREKGLGKIPDVKELPTSVKMAETVSRFSYLFNYHKHPLSLVTDEEDEDDGDGEEEVEEDQSYDDKMKICDVCVTPISSPPYYKCAAAACRYFVHSMCYLLPKTLSSSSSSSNLLGNCSVTRGGTHIFTLYTSSDSTDTSTRFIRCSLCAYHTDGRVYECEGCEMKIDVKCASLPTTIQHAFHRHRKPLTLCRIPPEEGQTRSKKCLVCKRTLSDIAAYCCNSEGCDSALDVKCAQLPQSITKPEWDDHPLMLTSDASLDHPTDFYCDLCEEELHPKKPMYHCRPCDHSFHLDCLESASGWFRNIKFGRRFELDGIHPHPLTFNHITLKKWCNICRAKVYNYCGFECASCYFTACLCCGGEELNELL